MNFSPSIDFAHQRTKKTGTTIAGVMFEDGVVLAADKRATVGATVVEPACEKIHFIAENIYACGAGTSADTHHVTRQVSSALRLLYADSLRVPRVLAAATQTQQKLFPYLGALQAALLFGGVDETGPALFFVSPNGTKYAFPFLASGSGTLPALAVLERGWRRTLSREAALQLLFEAVRAGAEFDLGSGYGVDFVVIDRQKTERIFRRGDSLQNERAERNYSNKNEHSVRKDPAVFLELVEQTESRVELTTSNTVQRVLSHFV